jgi:hypothetical protein
VPSSVLRELLRGDDSQLEAAEDTTYFDSFSQTNPMYMYEDRGSDPTGGARAQAETEGGARRRSSSGLNDIGGSHSIDRDSRELRRELFDDSIRSVRDSASRTDEGKECITLS